jgi:hypothetical protein
MHEAKREGRVVQNVTERKNEREGEGTILY